MMLNLLPRRKMFELVFLVVLCVILFFISSNIDFVILFGFGFVWNWTASNDMSLMFEKSKYRMSMVRLVFHLQSWVIKPFYWAPNFLKLLVKSLPAGFFWFLVIFMNDSHMPWWSTFVGSLSFELLQIEIGLFKKHKESI